MIVPTGCSEGKHSGEFKHSLDPWTSICLRWDWRNNFRLMSVGGQTHRLWRQTRSQWTGKVWRHTPTPHWQLISLVLCQGNKLWHGGAGVENPSLVFPTVGVADRDTPRTPQDKEPESANTPSQRPRHTTPPSHVASLRARFSAERISPQASSFLPASWREKSGRTYDSLFGKWASWCVEQDIGPISGDITGVVNFLADPFQQGYQHRSLCAYRSAISSVHEEVDGQSIGSHPMVSRFLKDAFHERPPLPRYSATWDVSVVANQIVSLGDNQNLSFEDLTLKRVMLLALTRPSRSMDLTNLDIRFRHYSPEGVTFQLQSATLTKQSRQTKPVRNFFFPKIEQNKKLCPVLTVQEYERRTTDERSPNGSTPLLIAMIRPHKPVSSSTVAPWLKTVLKARGWWLRSCLSKKFFLKVSVSWSGFGPSVARGKLSVRGRCVQATKTRQKLALSLTPLGAVRASAQGIGYKKRHLGKSHGVRFDSRTSLVCTVRCALSLNCRSSVFLLAFRVSLGALRPSLFYVHRSGCSGF